MALPRRCSDRKPVMSTLVPPGGSAGRLYSYISPGRHTAASRCPESGHPRPVLELGSMILAICRYASVGDKTIIAVAQESVSQ